MVFGFVWASNLYRHLAKKNDTSVIRLKKSRAFFEISEKTKNKKGKLFPNQKKQPLKKTRVLDTA